MRTDDWLVRGVADMGEVIRVEEVYFHYPGRDNWALDGLTMSINTGDYVAVIGPNGSGKSTLVRLFNGLLKPAAGKVLIEGKEVTDRADLWDIRAKVAMVFQNPDNQLVATMVEEDVAFGPENLGVKPEEIRTRVEDALSLVSLTEFRNYPPHMLSGGQKQRLAIAGALAMKPRVLVLDEPTSMLDPQGREEVLNAIRHLNKEEGLTVVHITHDPEEAVWAKRVIVVEGGKVALDGTPEEVLNQVQRLQELGLEVPQMVSLAEGLRDQGYQVPAQILRVEEMVEWLWSLL